MKIAMFEGYGFGSYRKRRRRKSSRRGGAAQRSRFAKAARACRGKSKGKFRACMRKKLKGRRR